MARQRLPKPVRFMLFGALVVAAAAVVAVVIAAILFPATESPEPVVVDPRVWHRAGAGELIEIEGRTFAIPVDCQYARLDGSYGPDLQGVLIVRADPKSPRQLVVGRIGRLTPETTIGYDRFGGAVLDLVRETREWGEDTRLIVFEAARPEYSPDRHAGLHLDADLYFFDDGLLRDRARVRDVLESVRISAD